MQQNRGDISAQMGLLVGRITRRWKMRLDERLSFTGLTQARWHALLALSRAGAAITQRDLAERMGVEPSTLVRHLDALAAQGLIERVPVENDRRANLVRLTPAAAPLIGQITDISDALRRDLTAGLPDADIAACMRVLTRVADRLEQP